MKNRGPQPRPDASDELLADLRGAFRWLADRPDQRYAAEPTGWWADASILRRLGPALAKPAVAAHVTHAAGPESRGGLLGALVAVELGVGLVELRKDPEPSTDSDRWLTARTPPDYQDRNLKLGLRRDLLPPGSRVLFVDDWIDTGGQATAARQIVKQPKPRGAVSPSSWTRSPMLGYDETLRSARSSAIEISDDSRLARPGTTVGLRRPAIDFHKQRSRRLQRRVH